MTLRIRTCGRRRRRGIGRERDSGAERVARAVVVGEIVGLAARVGLPACACVAQWARGGATKWESPCAAAPAPPLLCARIERLEICQQQHSSQVRSRCHQSSATERARPKRKNNQLKQQTTLLVGNLFHFVSSSSLVRSNDEIEAKLGGAKKPQARPFVVTRLALRKLLSSGRPDKTIRRHNNATLKYQPGGVILHQIASDTSW